MRRLSGQSGIWFADKAAPAAEEEGGALDIAGWLKDLGLEQYAPVFRDNDIEAETLVQLTADDLIALGIRSVGHRRKLLKRIDHYR